MSVKDYVLQDATFLTNVNAALRQIVFNKKKEDIERNDVLSMVHTLTSLLELYDHYIINSKDAVRIIDELVFQFLLKECDIDLEDDHYSSYRETLDKSLHLVSTRFVKSDCCLNTIIRSFDWLANCVDSIFDDVSDYDEVGSMGSIGSIGSLGSTESLESIEEDEDMVDTVFVD